MENIKKADPTALGLFGLAIVTLVASSQKLGLTNGLSIVVPWAIFLGGIVQIIAGILDYKKLNVFGGLAFLAYGFFWLGTSFSWMAEMGALGPVMQAAADPKQLGMAFIGYLIFTIYMTIGAANVSKVLFFIFIFIDTLFISLSLYSFGILPELTGFTAGLSELFIAILSFYGSAANIFLNHFGKPILNVGKPFNIFK